jgi:S-formylglutathione hydrolase FrmB
VGRSTHTGLDEDEEKAVRPVKHAAISRRTLLLGTGAVVGVGAAGLVAVNEEVLPGRSLLYRTLGYDGSSGTIPDIAPGRVTSGSFVSRARGASVGWSIARPPGEPRRLPVAVVLHGRGGDHSSAFSGTYLGLDRFLAAAVGGGVPPFALASVDGGETYWHDREDGDRCETMVLQEFLPLLQHHGLDTRRIGLFGWSMGGFGALHLAHSLGIRRIAGAAVMSPALWHTFDETPPGAYDDEADFDRVTVMDQQSTLAGIPVRVDCGESDPFYSATRGYLAGFADPPSGGFELGEHDVGYWRRIAPHGLRHLGHALHG